MIEIHYNQEISQVNALNKERLIILNAIDISYSSTFVNTIVSTYGSKGSKWLNLLPSIIEQSAQLWNLTNLKAYPKPTYNYVLHGMMGSKPIVLKLKCNSIELEEEIIAIKAYNGLGCIKIIDHDLSLKAIILEQAIPGKSLCSIFPENDRQATQIAADCIRSLHTAPIPANIHFKRVDHIIPLFKQKMAALAPFINYAKELRKKLLNGQYREVLLHGDFHHGNIVSTTNNRWIVIDPEGIIGDPVYDLAIYIRNPLIELMKSKEPLKLVSDRINDFSKALNYPAQHIYEWCYLQAVTSTYWSIEDRLDVTQHIAFLNLLESIKSHYNQ